MKALKVEMIDVEPMTLKEAQDLKYDCIKPYSGNCSNNGYLVMSEDGWSWYEESIFSKQFYALSEENDGTKILKEDVENFITDVDVMTVGDKTTIVNAHTLTGFDTVRHSSCVDPKNYSEELGKRYAMEEVVNDLWSHLGFVLQWARYGLNYK